MSLLQRERAGVRQMSGKGEGAVDWLEGADGKWRAVAESISVEVFPQDDGNHRWEVTADLNPGPYRIAVGVAPTFSSAIKAAQAVTAAISSEVHRWW